MSHSDPRIVCRVRGWARLSYWTLVSLFIGLPWWLIAEDATPTIAGRLALVAFCLGLATWGGLQLLVERTVIDAEQLTKRDMLGRVRSYPHRDIEHVLQMSGVHILYKDGRSVRLAAVSCCPSEVVAFLNNVRRSH